MNPSAASTFWRQAGMNYLQYLGVASQAVRLSLKVIYIYLYFNIYIYIYIYKF
jgi:hypothetical protein